MHFQQTCKVVNLLARFENALDGGAVCGQVRLNYYLAYYFASLRSEQQGEKFIVETCVSLWVEIRAQLATFRGLI